MEILLDLHGRYADSAVSAARRSVSPQPGADNPHLGDFARLRPLGFATKKAFSEVAALVDADSESYSRQIKHMRYWRYVSTQQGEAAPSVDEVLGWDGYYRFNMDSPPTSKPLGWQAGSGRQGISDKAVDFLLSTNPKRDNISVLHMRFCHKENTGFFAIFPNNSSLQVDEKKVSSENGDILASKSQIVSLGHLVYQFEWTDINNKFYSEQVQTLRQDLNLPLLSHLDVIEISPNATHFNVGEYSVRSTLRTDASPSITKTVFSALHIPSHKMVACFKVVVGTDMKDIFESYLSVQRDLKNLNHPHLQKVVDMIRNDRLDFLESYTFYDPLTCITLPQLISRSEQERPDMAGKTTLIRQYCEGLAAFHEYGLMHRSISPYCLGITTLKPLVGIISNCLIHTTEPQSYVVIGSPAWRAPEMSNINRAQLQIPGYIPYIFPYDNLVDIYGLGLVFLELIEGHFLPFDTENCMAEYPFYTNTIEKLSSWQNNPQYASISRLLLRMLAWNPAERCTAQMAAQEAVEIEKEWNKPPAAPVPKAKGKHVRDPSRDSDNEPESSKGKGKSKGKANQIGQLKFKVIAPKP